MQAEIGDVSGQVLTPMMQQYINIKQQHKDCLLFYRMGDFYELFFQDALTAVDILNIALTKRGKISGKDIAMCGVPYHASEQYLLKLIQAGFKVAVCDQVETPEEAKKRAGYKAIVRREVTRIITPGTLLEEELLDAENNNYLCGIALSGGQFAISYVDISTGKFYIIETNATSIEAELVRINPKEILISEKLIQDKEIQQLLSSYNKELSLRADNIFSFNRGKEQIKSYFGVQDISGFGNFSAAEVIAMGVLLDYLIHTQKTSLPKLMPPEKVTANSFMIMDAATRKNLELTSSIYGDKKSSLFYVMNKTKTASGSRLLATYMSAPLCNPEAIGRRLDNIDYFIQHGTDQVVHVLKHFPDMERALYRICSRRAVPRDLMLIRTGLQVAAVLAEQFNKAYNHLSDDLKIATSQLCLFGNLLTNLNNALNDDIATSIKSGGFISIGFSTQLDRYKQLKLDALDKINALCAKYRGITGVSNLKISRNNVIGYFVEVSPSNGHKVKDELFIHRQTLGSSVRFTTDELKRLQSDLINCDDIILAIEEQIFNDLCNEVINNVEQLHIIASSVTTIDIASALAVLAKANNYSRPCVDSSKKFAVERGRHPVVEKNIDDEFIANDCNNEGVWIITGPNMAGKSTFLRQNAIICIMAQMGSFVPCEMAHIGIVDKLFTRIGAGDDISRGQSTFMVEMIETANILNNATQRSMVILDEIGRGTATYDGLSLAWSIVEYLHDVIAARTIFATHYHELTDLENKLKNVTCYTANVREWQGRVVFLHEIIKGSANGSYGIHVAELAGIVKPVIIRASQILSSFSKEQHNIPNPANRNDLNVMAEKLKMIDLDAITAKQALTLLSELKNMVE